MKSLFKSSTILTLMLVSVLLTGCGGSDVQGGSGSQGESQSNKNIGVENREDASSNEDVVSNDEDASDKGQNSDDDEKNYPVIETADYILDGVVLETAENGQISCSYPADVWVASEETPGQLQIFWEETIGSGQAININISLASTSKVPAD